MRRSKEWLEKKDKSERDQAWKKEGQKKQINSAPKEFDLQPAEEDAGEKKRTELAKRRRTWMK